MPSRLHTSSSWLILPVIGWIGLLPLLLTLPIYADESQWNLINSRLLLDGTKLIYLFPACSRGILLDTPISWFPTRLLDAAFYSDMTNPQVLRYWSVSTFGALVLYCAWIARKITSTGQSYWTVTGAIVAVFSIGILPFLMILNRPEQGLMVALVLGCTIPAIVGKNALTQRQTWIATAVFVLLAWTITATHIKGIFLLPALMLAAFLTLRKLLPSLVVVAAAMFGAIETFRIWSVRTDCPESPFLTKVFRGQAMSFDDLNGGVVLFAKQAIRNILDIKTYLRNAEYQTNYQSAWLPGQPLTAYENVLNLAVPAMFLVGLAIVLWVFARQIRRWSKSGEIPSSETAISMALVAGLFCIAAFQKGKNFYETSMIFPLLALAVMLVLHSVSRKVWRVFVITFAIIAPINQIAFAVRFYPQLHDWRQPVDDRLDAQDTVRKLADKCSIGGGQATKHLVLDDFTYSVFWTTREPFLISYLQDWWAADVNASQVLRDRAISGVIAACPQVSGSTWKDIISEGGYCCGKPR